LSRDFLDKIFAGMLLGNQHVFQCLTKRPARMAAYVNDPDTKGRVQEVLRELWFAGKGKPTKRNPSGLPVPAAALLWPAPYIWLGTSIGCQETAEKFAPALCSIAPGWFCWISAEPLIGSLKLRPAWVDGTSSNRIGWVVCGGESGNKGDTRPMLPAWESDLRRFCVEGQVPYWYKQRGNWEPMNEDDRNRFLHDPELMGASAKAGAVCALDKDGKTIRGAKVFPETLKGETPLFWYETKKHSEATEAAALRQFPPFPGTFARAEELKAAYPFSFTP
jgi:protein gp37